MSVRYYGAQADPRLRDPARGPFTPRTKPGTRSKAYLKSIGASK